MKEENKKDEDVNKMDAGDDWRRRQGAAMTGGRGKERLASAASSGWCALRISMSLLVENDHVDVRRRC